ncbi:hypothetical protein [Streptomyces sp. NPDC006739]|uniref:hypothetical protein n=1 Tax=Streptomyces sp. NPDC006739 TaxID=3364763 RepID=UPI00368B8F47
MDRNFTNGNFVDEEDGRGESYELPPVALTRRPGTARPRRAFRRGLPDRRGRRVLVAVGAVLVSLGAALSLTWFLTQPEHRPTALVLPGPGRSTATPTRTHTGTRAPTATDTGPRARNTSSASASSTGSPSGTPTSTASTTASTAAARPPSGPARATGPGAGPGPGPSGTTGGGRTTGPRHGGTGTSPTPGGSGSGTSAPPRRTGRAETEGNRHGADTFANHTSASGAGPHLGYLVTVTVTCKVYDPAIGSASPGGYWYLIASPPWSGGYFAVANTFLNGDPVSGPYTHDVDTSVPDCPAS